MKFYLAQSEAAHQLGTKKKDNATNVVPNQRMGFQMGFELLIGLTAQGQLRCYCKRSRTDYYVRFSCRLE